jgi:hypothetical protein
VVEQSGGDIRITGARGAGSRFWAEVRVGDEHLRLFSEHSPLGVQASVYNVNAKNWIAPSEPVDDIEQGKTGPRPMPGNIFSTQATWTCRRWSGRSRAPRSLQKPGASLVGNP